MRRGGRLAGDEPAIMERRIEACESGSARNRKPSERGGRPYHEGIGTVEDDGRQNSKGSDGSENGGSSEGRRAHGGCM